MEKKLHMTAICLVLVASMGAGCFGTKRADESTLSVTSTGSAGSNVAPAPVNQGCTHPYAPLRGGYSADYETNASGKLTSYTMRVTDSVEGQVKLFYRFDNGLSAEQELACAGGQVTAKGYVDFASAWTNKQMKITTTNVTGVFLPKDLKVGSTWENTYDVRMESQDPVMIQAGLGTINAKVKMSHKVLAEERVLVKAGSYTALKVQTTTTVTTDAPAGTKVGVVATSFTSTEWWAKDVGLVKMQMKQGTANFTTEAVSVTLPR